MVFTHIINLTVFHKYRVLHGNICRVRSVICWTFFFPWCPGFQELAWHAQLLCEPVPEINTRQCLPSSAHVATRAKTRLPNECRLGFSFQQACYWGLSHRCFKVLSGPQYNVVLSDQQLGPWALPTVSEMSQRKFCESVLGTYPAGAGEVHESERGTAATLPTRIQTRTGRHVWPP